MTRGLRCAVALVAMLLSTPARADDVAEAKRYFDAGAQAFAVGQFEAASQAFEHSFALAARPGTLFSLGQSERRQFVVDRNPAHLRRAAEAFRRYVDGEKQGGRRADAVDALAEVEGLLARASETAATQAPASTRLMVTARSGARVALDGAPFTDTPFIREVQPGKHALVVDAPGFVAESREVLANPGALIVVDVALQERPGALVVLAPGASEVFIDGVPRGASTRTVALVAGGSHEVMVLRNGKAPWRGVVDVERGGHVEVTADLRDSSQRKLAIYTLAGGVGSVVAAGLFTFPTLARERSAQEFLDRRSRGPVTSADLASYDAEVRARDTWRTVTLATAGVGAVLLTAGTLLYVFDRPTALPSFEPHRETPSLVVRPQATREGFGALLRGTF